jgi:alkylhydroperoxidase family enzyme
MTWLPIAARDGAERDAVLGLVPEPYAVVRRALARAWQITDPGVLELCRRRLAQLASARAELAACPETELAALEAWESDTRLAERERAALAFAEQYHYDHNLLSHGLQARLLEHLTWRELVNFVWALHMNDSYIRIVSLLDLAPDPETAPPRPERTPPVDVAPGTAGGGAGTTLQDLTDPEFYGIYQELNPVIVRQSRVDDLTSEAIRLRNARHQGCVYCMSVRRTVERPADARDLMDEAVDYEASRELTERQKVALRLHTAFLTHPAGLTADGRAEALAHYSAAEIVELAFKFFWWSTNRATVTLGFDREPHDPERLRSFHYEPDGAYVVHPVA